MLDRALPEHRGDDDLVAAVMDLTGGNPFFVGAVTDAMRAGEDPTSTTPGSVRRQVSRRLARLGQSASALAKAASVIGDDGSLRDVSRIPAWKLIVGSCWPKNSSLPISCRDLTQ